MINDEAVTATRLGFMQMAVALSEQALGCGGRVSFGAIIVQASKIVGSSGNWAMEAVDLVAHAEIRAIRDARKNLQCPA